MKTKNSTNHPIVIMINDHTVSLRFHEEENQEAIDYAKKAMTYSYSESIC